MMSISFILYMSLKGLRLGSVAVAGLFGSKLDSKIVFNSL